MTRRHCEGIHTALTHPSAGSRALLCKNSNQSPARPGRKQTHGTREIGATRELDPRLGACSREAGKSGERSCKRSKPWFWRKTADATCTDSLAGKRRRTPALFVSRPPGRGLVDKRRHSVPAGQGLEDAALACGCWCRVQRGLGNWGRFQKVRNCMKRPSGGDGGRDRGRDRGHQTKGSRELVHVSCRPGELSRTRERLKPPLKVSNCCQRHLHAFVAEAPHVRSSGAKLACLLGRVSSSTDSRHTGLTARAVAISRGGRQR